MPSGARLRTDVDFRAGTFFDGTRMQVIVTPTWNVSPHLELGGDYQLTRLRFGERDQSGDIHLARLRIRAALDARASGNAFVQYNSTTDRLDLNVRLATTSPRARPLARLQRGPRHRPALELAACRAAGLVARAR